MSPVNYDLTYICVSINSNQIYVTYMLCQRPLSMKAKFKDILPVIERKGCPWSRLEVCRVTVSLVASPVCRPMPSIPPRGVPSVEPPTREPRVPVSPCVRDPVSVCTQDTLTHHAQCGEQDEWRKSSILLTQLLAIPIEIPLVGCQLSMHFCICIQNSSAPDFEINT